MNIRENQPAVSKPPRQIRDFPGCIKYVILLFLIALLVAEGFAGEYRPIFAGQFSAITWLSWAVLIFKLLLIALLIWLIRVQRDLKCEVTGPTGCVAEETDTVAGNVFIRVQGSAGGLVFGHYILEILQSGSPISGIGVTYPAGGASGSVPVSNGELGRINTTSLSDGSYTIRLTVYPAGAGSPSVCTGPAFNLLKVAVYITSVAGVPAVPNCFDASAELVQGMHIRSLGGTMHLLGSAYVYGCPGRQIARYEIRHHQMTVPGPAPAQPATDDPIPATWPAANVLSPLPLVYDPSKYWPWTKVGPFPSNLINSWGTLHVGAPPPGGTDYPILAQQAWGSSANGRFSFLLIVEDTDGHRYYDSQVLWLDNRPITVKIVKFQGFRNSTSTWEDLPTCEDIRMSIYSKIRIVGLAWDPLIDLAFPATAPNDNFDYYNIVFWKQFSPAASALTGNVSTRVPAATAPVPTDADAGPLAEWPLTWIDADAPLPMLPDPVPPAPIDAANKIHRGESCTYTVQLFATDTTIVSESSTHYKYSTVPLKIINDLPAP